MQGSNQKQPRLNLKRGGFHGGRPTVGGLSEKSKNFRGTLKKIMIYLKPYYKSLIIILILALFSIVFSILGPKILGVAVDNLYNAYMNHLHHVPDAGVDFSYIIHILLILTGIYVIGSISGYFQEYMLAGVSQKIIYRLRNEVNQKLHHLPLQFFDSKTHGEILSRVTNDIDTISNTFQQSLVQIIISLFTLIGILIMMLSINIWLTLIALLTLPLGMFIAVLVVKKSQKHFSGQQKVLGELNGYVEEMYSGYSVIKAFNLEQKTIGEFDRINNELYSHGWKSQFVSSVIFPLLNFVGNLTFVGICILGGYLTATGRITLGSVQAFINYSRQFNQPITQVANMMTILQSTVAAAERVFEILEEPEEIPDPVQPKEVIQPKGEVRLKDLSFRYQPDKPLIDDLNIQVSPGQLIAIVGPTGAGKTTLVNLLMRFYEIDHGNITIDGINITEMTKKELHHLFGMVLQDTWLFKGTIRDNIAYGKEGATDEEIFRAAQIALADNFIRTLPDGYDTIINEDATNISQGQKQLLTIARAVIANPKILILDEATSSVDTRTEVLIQKVMSELMEGRTSFVIAHRLSTIRDADCILVMKEGKIIEKGTHLELLSKNGFYKKLYCSQFEKIKI